MREVLLFQPESFFLFIIIISARSSFRRQEKLFSQAKEALFKWDKFLQSEWAVQRVLCHIASLKPLEWGASQRNQPKNWLLSLGGPKVVVTAWQDANMLLSAWQVMHPCEHLWRTHQSVYVCASFDNDNQTMLLEKDYVIIKQTTHKQLRRSSSRTLAVAVVMAIWHDLWRVDRIVSHRIVSRRFDCLLAPFNSLQRIT